VSARHAQPVPCGAQGEFKVPATSSVSTSGNADIDGVLSGYKWAVNNITFSFPTSTATYSYGSEIVGFEAMNDAQKTAVRSILSLYGSYINVSFTEVNEASTQGTFRFAEENNAGTAYAYYPSSGDWGGDVWFNHSSYNNPVKGTYAYATVLHELGHSMGLDHGQDGLAALPTDHDTLEYSVMTYRSFVGADLNGYTVMQGSYPTTLMINDIAALQYMYGANYTTNSGNTVYTWSSTTGENFINGVGQGASTTNTIFMALWDGGGNDTYDFSNYATNLSVDLAPGGWTTTSSTQLANLGGYWFPGQNARGNISNAYLYQNNTASLIENAVGGTGNDTLKGNQANNTLTGNAGADSLFGFDGDDSLVGGLGNDRLDGGNGTDYCIINATFAACTVTYDANTQTYLLVNGTFGSDTLKNIEFITFSDGTRSITSLSSVVTDTTAPTLASFTPADNATGVAGSANIVLTFSENVLAGAGNIVIRTMDGTAVATIAANSGLVSIANNVVTINPSSDLLASTSYYVTIDANAFTDTSSNAYAGISNATSFNFTTLSSVINGTSSANTLNGTAGNDTINGLGGNDTINGLDGNDQIDGGAGSDRMNGGRGDDIYTVDSTADVVTEGSASGTDTVRSSVTFSLGANIENLTLLGSNAIAGTGNELANAINGNSAANTLTGNGGNDRLDGLGGRDTLRGGAGQDTFVFSTALGSGNVDTISDFSTVEDTIALSRSVFSALSLGALSASAFVVGARAADASDRIIYTSSTGALYYDADGSGAGGMVQFATLSRNLALTASDFILVA
jgi:serralysin